MTNHGLVTRAPLIIVVVALVVAIGGVAVTAYASQNALPGDPLHAAKLSLEVAQITLTQGPENDAQLHLEFAQERLDEVAALIAEGRFDDLAGAAAQFETHLRRAIQNLSSVTANDPAKGEKLALSISDALFRYSGLLAAFRAAVPVAAQPAIDQALQTSQVAIDVVGISEVEVTDRMVSTDGALTARDVELAPRSVVEDKIADRIVDGGEIEDEVEDAFEVTAGDEIEFSGTLQNRDGATWMIDGRRAAVTVAEIGGLLQVGDVVKVHARSSPDGTLIVREVELADDDELDDMDDMDDEDEDAAEMDIIGVLESKDGATWMIDGRALSIAMAEIKDLIKVGDTVRVRARHDAEGMLTVRRIELADHSGRGHGDEEDEDRSGTNSGSGGHDDDDGEHKDRSGSNSGSDGDEADDD